MSGCTPTEITCSCYCHKVNKLLSEKCSCCKTDSKNLYVDVHMLHTMRQTIETWQKGCALLISNMQERIAGLEVSFEYMGAKMEIKHPHKCPNCQGKKLSCFEDNYLKAHIHTLDCKCIICNGTGIVWG